jgi:hypothetical protein
MKYIGVPAVSTMNEETSFSDQTLVPLPVSSQAGSTWQFVVFDSPQTAMTERNRRQVRSHVMRRHHRRSRDLNVRGLRPLRENEVELQWSAQDTVEPLQDKTDDTEGYWPHIPTEFHSFTANLGTGRSDPFFLSSIRMGRREHELYDHREFHNFI